MKCHQVIYETLKVTNFYNTINLCGSGAFTKAPPTHRVSISNTIKYIPASNKNEFYFRSLGIFFFASWINDF